MLKFIDKVVVGFSPLGRVSRSARAFVPILRTNKNLARNPKCVFDIIVSDTTSRPFVMVQYVDKRTIRLDTSAMTPNEILEDLQKHSKKLQMEEDIRSST
ncbi:hypothetical protein BASA50_002013 [Batrachochytrium salamandrivorans]|uniref:Large ribosomal subunit protein mL53 n=1 Tax=Batrachochytrium salamandrivorans TaxID=1357716 RepID=A0ABQ8FMI5_9FUNG|nr:hypothetical protein BASA62_003226 [Batrachochytrium salamandrivorans]KAH6578176.1 hypothetical protein BASA60_003772 [Batrachochytrium salamandrivorans]KAH6580767.1 hypothetical protein BASA61_009441 [Batrachochytrium salamandrivorans]KAH6600844.1 hypothetical protein BASA50_002013 [Batrachochytrium salamandrivorans]KAH9266624.1 hypothetical protein BASA83_010428 [Batrachochytrium salamandrivorans]